MINDDGWVRWAIGALVGGMTVVWGHLNMRINRSDDSIDRKLNDLWAALEKHRTDNIMFREMVLRELPTKEDMKRLEDRLTAAIHERSLH